MIEVYGNLWEYPADVRVITTNGTVKKNGEAVMGRGCAAEAKARFPHLPKLLGEALKVRGNKVHYFYEPGNKYYICLFTFPVKHQWMQKADLALIGKSAKEIQEMALESWTTIVMPRPGCGNGGLRWCWWQDAGYKGRCQDPDCDGVKHVISPILDDRFHVISPK